MTSILFACIHNSGRSVAAETIARRLATERGLAVVVRSAGSEPKDAVNPVVAEALQEKGFPLLEHVPSRLTPELVQASDIVITMGCGETCPVFPGHRYEDWPVEDPAGQDLEQVRRIVAVIDRRVRELLDGL